MDVPSGPRPAVPGAASTPIPRAGAPLSEHFAATARLAAPIVAAQIGQMALGVVGSAVAGRHSDRALAEVALGNAIFWGTASIGFGCSISLDALVSQAQGAREPGRAYGSLLAALRAAAIVSLPLMAASVAATFLLYPLGVERDLARGTLFYLLVRLASLPLWLWAMAFRSYLQATGGTSSIVGAAVAANVANVALGPVLCFGDPLLARLGLPAVGLPALGSVGIGLALTGASVALAAVMAVQARRRRPARVERVAVTVPLRVGMPIGFQIFAEAGLFSLTGMLIGRFGPTVVASHQIALTLASLSFTGALGVSAATAVRVGRAIGAGDARAARRAGFAGMGVVAMWMGTAALAFALFPRQLLGVFTHEAHVIEVGAQLLAFAAAFQLFDGVQAVAAGALRGASDVRAPFVAAVVVYWLVGFPLAATLGFPAGLGVRGCWMGLTTALALIAVVLVARFAVVSGRPARRL